MKKITKRSLTMSLLCSTLVIYGCASYHVYDQYNPEHRYTEIQQLDNDEMIAIGQSLSSEDPELDNSLVFIGKKYTYLMTSGTQNFPELIKEFPANKLILESNLPIEFDFVDSTRFMSKITFRYADPVDKIPQPQKERLQQLGFSALKTYGDNKQNEETYLVNSFDYRGQIYQPVDSTKVEHVFSKAYPISLTKKQAKSTKNVGNITKTILLTPLALSFDIVTSPIQGSFLAYCLHTNKCLKITHS